MKRIEFKAKYTNSTIEILRDIFSNQRPPSIDLILMDKVSKIDHICKELGLGREFTEQKYATLQGDIQLVHIFDPNLQTRNYPLSFRYEDFIAEWELTVETERKEKEEQEKEKYKNLELLLKQNGIETESFTEVNNNPEYLKHIKTSGFIQSRTNLNISLWWHHNGERVVFICGQGIFKLSSIK